ncbi:hypothetical protein ANOM_000948 [Aspergillus nomiae NRRL 13137]|uniref:Rhodopsin domain-containing protein n=1 Tax=Aspergillus nomiae NRRL (strain ATCC 15546 / NRRL 13137 / CBS 260.88 / M93) TaxID=1509407 RepID=A0A0L1JGN1_ASPN3|nr:uncharacterized protein ANOM_000948 [Aspergillus nomiae NRRL 13137]KNG90872.1 hypothetical protein ANOM_000948 [Aspergillus nomiae NRRL 13137]
MTTRAADLVGVVISFLILALGTVALRCYVRLRIKRGFGLDDGLAVGALIFFVIAASALLEGVRIGSFGYSWTELTPEVLLKGLKLLFLYELSYVVATTMVKFAVGVFLLRFCIERYHKWIIYAILILLSCLTIFIFIFVIIQCRPPSWFWNQAITPHGSCDGRGFVKAAYVHSAITAFSDATLGLLPILIVRSLHLPYYIKVHVAVILALGSVACFATVARMYFVHQLTDPKNLFYFTGVICWSYVEVGVALITSSAATLRPLVDQVECCVPRWRRLKSHQYTSNGSNHHVTSSTTFEEALQQDNPGMSLAPITPLSRV